MPLPDDYLAALERLAFAFTSYRERTGGTAVLVGGAAAAIYTAGQFPSADFDVVAAGNREFEAAMAEHGFQREDRAGHLLIGFYHPDHPGYGFQQVSGALFDGRSDQTRLFRVAVTAPGEITLPPIEDMIADRLGQHAVASPTDTSRLQQAQALFLLAETLDKDYMLNRIVAEGGDPALLGPDPRQ